jgi:Ran GTPase-activating protein (RanGAP) involved in mRNA processing and transport
MTSVVIPGNLRMDTMDKREQQQRERADKIWEDEGRVDGSHVDDWRRAEDQHEETEREADEEIKQEAAERTMKAKAPPVASGGQ